MDDCLHGGATAAGHGLPNLWFFGDVPDAGIARKASRERRVNCAGADPCYGAIRVRCNKMQNLGKFLIVSGFLVTIVSQLVGAFLSFRLSVIKGVLSIFIPGYLLLAMHRSGHYRSIVGAWCFGVVAAIIGVILLS